MALQAFHVDTNDSVNSGDKVTDFRGQEWEFVMPTRESIPGKSSKVVVKDEFGRQREFYGNVVNLDVKVVD